MCAYHYFGGFLLFTAESRLWPISDREIFFKIVNLVNNFIRIFDKIAKFISIIVLATVCISLLSAVYCSKLLDLGKMFALQCTCEGSECCPASLYPAAGSPGPA